MFIIQLRVFIIGLRPVYYLPCIAGLKQLRWVTKIFCITTTFFKSLGVDLNIIFVQLISFHNLNQQKPNKSETSKFAPAIVNCLRLGLVWFQLITKMARILEVQETCFGI